MMLRDLTTLLTLAVLAAPASAVWQDEAGDKKGTEETKKKDEKKDEKPVEDRWFVVTGGDIYTGKGEVLRGATLLAKNGKIDRLGYDLDVPKDAKALDATGMRVYPGLVAMQSNGLLGNASGEFDDTINPFDYRMILGLATGITTTGSGSVAVKLKRFCVDGAVINDRAFVSLTWSNRTPRSKGELREKFKLAAEYLRQYREWERKSKDTKDLPEPAKKNVDTTVLSVLKGESAAKFSNNDRDELLGIAHLAQEFNFRPVIEGCHEGWIVADELGRAGARVIVTARDRRLKDEQQVADGGSSIENAAILHKAGVQVAILPGNEGVDLSGIVGRDIMHLPIEAGFAIRGGLPEQAALESITIVPARILGVANRVGSLEVGKDADLIVTDGDLLHYKTFVQWAVVDGKVVYDKEKELFFAHIRPRPVAPEEKKLDKGESAPSKESGDKKDDASKDGEKKDGEKKDDEKKDDEKKDD